MGTTPNTGDNDIHFVKLETTFDMIANDAANISFAGTDAIRLNAFDPEPNVTFHEINEYNGSPSLEGEVRGKEQGTYSASGNVRLNAAGTEPPMSPIFQAAFGGDVVIAGSCSYPLNSTVAVKSLMFLKHSKRNSKTELYTGCWVSELSNSIEGEGAVPTHAFSGGYASYSFIYGEVEIDSAAGTSVVIDAADRKKLNPVGLRLAFGADNNGGSGYLCTAYNQTTGTITISTSIIGSPVATDIVAPVIPTESFDGTVQGGTACGLSIDAVSLGFISYKDKIATGIVPLMKEANSAKPTGLEIGAPRRIDGELMFYFKDENVAYLGDSWNNTISAIIARAGPDVSGSRIKYNSPATRIHTAKISAAKSEVTTWSATFKNRKNAAADDEYSILCD